MSILSASIVLYQNPQPMVRRALASLLATHLPIDVCLVDNSPDTSLGEVAADPRVHYYHPGHNLGFGAGHNAALSLLRDSKYHIVINPDVYFDSGPIEKLFTYMEENEGVGLAMPKILYPNGSIQYLCKKLPTPFDLFLRRFVPAPLQTVFDRRLAHYEFRHTDYNQVRPVPCLSGCFMFLRRDAFARVGGFDERFFMYMEDVDLSRRIAREYKTMYVPLAEVYHEYARGSYAVGTLRAYHIKSAITYFDKWGWLFDRERRRLNELANLDTTPVSPPPSAATGT